MCLGAMLLAAQGCQKDNADAYGFLTYMLEGKNSLSAVGIKEGELLSF